MSGRWCVRLILVDVSAMWSTGFHLHMEMKTFNKSAEDTSHIKQLLEQRESDTRRRNRAWNEQLQLVRVATLNLQFLLNYKLAVSEETLRLSVAYSVACGGSKWSLHLNKREFKKVLIIKDANFMVVKPCSLVDVNRLFRGKYFLHTQGRKVK